MRRLVASHALLATALAGSLVIACSASPSETNSSSTSGTGASGNHQDAGPDADAVMLRIDPPTDSETASLGAAPAAVTYRAYAKTGAAAEHEVTSEVDWSIDTKLGAFSGTSGVATLTGNGGKGTVTATLGAAQATSALTVKVTGDVFLAGTDATTKASFDGAAADADPTAAPALEYPEDGVVLPANLPPFEAQWTQAADNAAYRVHVTSPDVLDVAFYTTARELLLPTDAWSTIRLSTADAPTQLTVDGLGSGKLRTSAPRTFTVTSDSIDDSAIYVWQSSTGTFRVLDLEAGTDIPFPNDSPALAPGQPCSGCHRISRDGKRFAYTSNGAGFEFGSMVYDDVKGLFTSKITPAPAFRATYASFNPQEATQVPAMLLTAPDNVTQNTAGTVRIQVVDPDTGMPVMNNLAASVSMIDPAIGHATSMPDWSPDGAHIVFAAYDSDKNFVRLLGDDIVSASIVEAPVTYSPTSGFTFGAPKVLVAAPPASADGPDTGENNILPTYSPDGSAVAFTRAAGWWSLKTQASPLNLSGQIVVVRRSDGQVLPLLKGSNGAGTTASSTWPQWAPSIGKRFAWLAYSTERAYGHRLTPTSPENAQCAFVQGQKQCKHLWVTAIDTAKLASGSEDPSSAPFFIPGQTLAAQYVSPQWTKAVIASPK